MGRIIAESQTIAGIPVMTLIPEGAERCPVVFYIHGFSGCKEHEMIMGYRLARAGIIYVAFDALWHGERADERTPHAWDSDPAADIYPDETGLDRFLRMHQVIIQCAEDFATLMAHFVGDSRMDLERVGVTGISMGGFATHYLAAADPRVKVAAPIVGIPAFTARWMDVTLEAASYERWREAMAAVDVKTDAFTAWMQEVDPFKRLADFAPRPLLMVCGDRDVDCPKVYSVQLYRSLLEHYGETPERLRLSIHDGADHRVTEGMELEVIEWFKRYL